MFAEINFSTPNSRLFNVIIEGAMVIPDLDICAEVSSNTAYNETFFVDISDGYLNISLTGVKENAKISAIKVLQIASPRFNLNVNAENGSIELSPAGSNYAENTVVTLTAKPNADYKFSEWSGDLSGKVNPVTITMNENRNITALFSLTTGINDLSNPGQEQTKLGQNYPNPFQTGTTIPYLLSEQSYVRISIYNYLGQQVANLVNEIQNAGKYEVYWDAKNSQGKQLESGVYTYRLETQNKTIIGEKLLISNAITE